MWMLDGKRLPPDTPFEHEGVRYPANWLSVSSPEDKAAIGVTEVVEQPRPDDRFYWIEDNGDGTYTATPKDLNQCKSGRISEVKAQANAMLAPTDWYVVRKGETGEAIPLDVADYRMAVRNMSDANELAINACTSVEELQACVNVWPVPPDGAMR